MAAEVSQLTNGSDIIWSGGAKFNGYVLLTMTRPGSWPQVSLKDCSPPLRVPEQVKVPIREGKYDSGTGLWRTDSLVPPGVVYATAFYDDNDRLIAAGATIAPTVAVYTLAPPTLPDPS
jgi:hypothetical protein